MSEEIQDEEPFGFLTEEQKSIRITVLEASLILEKMVSINLAAMVGILNNLDKTYSFSNKTSALSFAQKIQLLIDINALEHKDKNTFIIFMEVRNQLMHNIKVNTIPECIYNHLSNRKQFILDLYEPEPGEETDDEAERLVVGFAELLSRVLVIAHNIDEKIKEKFKKEIIEEGNSKIFYEIINETKKHKERMKTLIPDKTKMFTGEEVDILIEKHIDDLIKRAVLASVEK